MCYSRQTPLYRCPDLHKRMNSPPSNQLVVIHRSPSSSSSTESRVCRVYRHLLKHYCCSALAASSNISLPSHHCYRQADHITHLHAAITPARRRLLSSLVPSSLPLFDHLPYFIRRRPPCPATSPDRFPLLSWNAHNSSNLESQLSSAQDIPWQRSSIVHT